MTVANAGGRTGTFEVALTVDGETAATRRVRLDPGEEEAIAFDPTFVAPGDYDLAVEGVAIGTVTVEESAESTPTSTAAASTEPTRRLSVIAVGSLPDWVRTGFNASVRVTVANRGNATASRTLNATVDGEPVASRTVSLAPGERTTVVLEFPATEGDVAVDGISAGDLAVRSGSTEAPTTTGSGPALHPALVVLLIAAVALLLGSRGPGAGGPRDR